MKTKVVARKLWEIQFIGSEGNFTKEIFRAQQRKIVDLQPIEIRYLVDRNLVQMLSEENTRKQFGISSEEEFATACSMLDDLSDKIKLYETELRDATNGLLPLLGILLSSQRKERLRNMQQQYHDVKRRHEELTERLQRIRPYAKTTIGDFVKLTGLGSRVVFKAGSYNESYSPIGETDFDVLLPIWNYVERSNLIIVEEAAKKLREFITDQLIKVHLKVNEYISKRIYAEPFYYVSVLPENRHDFGADILASAYTVQKECGNFDLDLEVSNQSINPPGYFMVHTCPIKIGERLETDEECEQRASGAASYPCYDPPTPSIVPILVRGYLFAKVVSPTKVSLPGIKQR